MEFGTQRRNCDGRIALPTKRCRRHQVVWWRATPRCVVPLVVKPPRLAAVGRTNQPLGCRKRGLAGALLAGIPRHCCGNYSRPLLLGQRCQMDFGTGSRARHSFLGQLHKLAGTKTRTTWPRREIERRTQAHVATRVGLGAHGTEGSSVQR